MVEESCALCALPVTETGVRVDGRAYCCQGCRDVDAALDDIDAVDADAVRERAAGTTRESTEVPADHSTSFLEVRGMYCSTCEAFIESLASTVDGVSATQATYVTETVRVDHDPEKISESELCERVSGLGYEAFPRDDAVSRRHADNWAFARLAIGVLVGMMVMMQYVLVIYPTYFGGLFYDQRTAEFLADMLAASGGTYFLAVIGLLTTIVLTVTGKPILRGAFVSIRTRQPNMDLLVTLAAVSAYLYSSLTIVTGGTTIYYDVTVAIILIVTVGNHHESTIKREATERLSDLTRLQVDEARRVSETGHEDVAVEDLIAGDRVLVRNGERIPIDGRVVEGAAAIDEAVVTGEALPIHKSEGERVVGGSIVTEGTIVISVAEGATNSLDRIANLVWDLQSASSGIQKLADRLATIFVPTVLVLAIVVAGAYLAFGATMTAAMLVGLTVLIVSCPCALGLATPLAVAAGLREALDRHIVIFDETVFERLRGADTVVFDKTGTLTTGDLEVVCADAPDDLLQAAAALEERSSHPVGRSIVEAFRPVPDGGELAAERTDAGDDAIERFESYAKGVSGEVGGTPVMVGHPDIFVEAGWTIGAEITNSVESIRQRGALPIVVGRAGAAEGVLELRDAVRDGWDETVHRLQDRGIEIVVLTGDEGVSADRFRDHEGVDRVFAGVPPEGKAETVGRLAQRGQTVMVGDGTNDAPALARADLGIALGGGTAMAVDAADVAIVNDDLRSVESVFELSGATGRRLKENIGWAFCYNAIAIPLAVTGLLNPLFAAVAMATSSILVVSNSSRSLLGD